jgi:two-component system response regulator FixJ
VYRTRETPTVFVIDSDRKWSAALQRTLESASLRVETFVSGTDFLAMYTAERPGCIVANAGLSDLSGRELLQRLRCAGAGPPVILISNGSEVATAVEALHLGARDFLERPLRSGVLLERVQAALVQDAAARRFRALRRLVAARAVRLTAREREVLNCVCAGLTNKAIAARLGVSCKVVEAHRAHAMHKMQTRSIAEVVRMLIVLTGDVEGPLAEWVAEPRTVSEETLARPGGPVAPPALQLPPSAEGRFEHGPVSELDL